MIAKKWNYETHRRDKIELPDTWNCKAYTPNSSEIVNCPHCGNEFKFGDGYTSFEILTKAMGFGYAVCEDCYSHEIERKDKDAKNKKQH